MSDRPEEGMIKSAWGKREYMNIKQPFWAKSHNNLWVGIIIFIWLGDKESEKLNNYPRTNL